MDAGAIPALVPVVAGDGRGRELDRPDGREEVRVEEEREREPVARGRVADAVRRGAEQAAGHAIEHVADVADERARDRRGGDPPRARLHLEAAGVDVAAAQKLAAKVKSGAGFDLNDFLGQLQQMKQMGGLSSLMDKLPAQMAAKATEAEMTRAERDILLYNDLE